MELKKTEEASLERKKVSLFLLGYIFNIIVRSSSKQTVITHIFILFLL